jgi:hypothetical protein
MHLWNGLKIGGQIRCDLAAYHAVVPLVSLHRPGRMCWSWLLEWVRPRSGRRFGITILTGHQSRTIIGLGIGDLQFVRQHESN